MATKKNKKTITKREGRAEWLAHLNKKQRSKATVEHVETIAFGSAHSVERYRLSNGLTVLILEDHSAPVIAYHTWFSVGSRHEKPGKTGLAHLFEHLMFNETENCPRGQFDRKLEEVGAETNAATWVDWTFYYENVPSDQLRLVVNLEAERMSKLVLRDPQVDSEKEVVANERRMRVDDDVDGTVSELLYKTVFQRHGYGWPTIGWMPDIEGFTTKDCESFYSTFYMPNNATIVVVGDVDQQVVMTEMARAYGGLQAANIPAEDVQPEPTQVEQRQIETVQPTVSEKLVIGYRAPALDTADHIALTAVNEVLFGGRSSWGYRDLVRDNELATDVRGWVATFKDEGLYEISSNARAGVTCEQMLARIEPLLEKIVHEPVDLALLEKVKARLELSALQGLETAGGKAEQIGFWETVTGDPSGAFRRLAQIRRLTQSDLLRAARRYLVKSSRTLLFVRCDEATDSRSAA